MKNITLLEILLVIAAIGFLVGCGRLAAQSWSRRDWPTFSNFNAGIHVDAVTRSADAVLAFLDTNDTAAGYLLKEGTTAGATVAIIAAASDKPAFIALDGADAIGDPVTCGLLEATDKTRKMIATGAIAAGVGVYSYGDGTVSVAPTLAGTYWKVGESRSSSTGTGDILEIETCQPEKLVIVAAPTIGAGVVTTATTISTPYGFATQAQGDSVVARVNQLLVDVAALQAGIATPAKLAHA